MFDEEEGELEEDDDKEESGQDNQEEKVNDGLYRKLWRMNILTVM